MKDDYCFLLIHLSIYSYNGTIYSYNGTIYSYNGTIYSYNGTIYSYYTAIIAEVTRQQMFIGDYLSYFFISVHSPYF